MKIWMDTDHWGRGRFELKGRKRAMGFGAEGKGEGKRELTRRGAHAFVRV